MRNAVLIAALCAPLFTGCDNSSKPSAKAAPPLPAESSVAKSFVPDEPRESFAGTNLDLGTKVISGALNSSTPRRLYEELIMLAPPKGQYESTADFNLRMKRVSKATVLDGVRVDAVFAFRALDSSVQASYDADRQILKYELRPHEVSWDGFNGIEVARLDLPHNQFEFDNRYFAEKGLAIDHSQNTYVSLGTKRLPGLSYIYGQAKMSPKDALLRPA